MGDLVRFIKPSNEKLYKKAAENLKNTLVNSVCNPDGGGAIDDLSIGLVRGFTEVFYFMYEKNVSPEKICAEIDWVMASLKENMPKIKENVWRWSREDGDA